MWNTDHRTLQDMGHHERWLREVYLFQLKQLRDGTWEAIMGATRALWDAVYTGGLGRGWRDELKADDVAEELMGWNGQGWVYHPE